MGKKREIERAKSLIYWFTPNIPATAKERPDQSQEPEIPSDSPTGLE